MAYLIGLQDFGGAGWVRSVAKIAPRKRERDDFDALERNVLAIALRDRLSTLAEPGRLGRILRIVFGVRRSLRLADPRLESLRRMAVLVRHHGQAVAPAEVTAFLAAGFTLSQFGRLLRDIGTDRLARVQPARS